MRCPICHASAPLRRSFATRGEERIALRACAGCRGEFLDPQPSGKWLAAEYAGYYRRRASGVPRPRREYFRELLAAHAVLPEGGRAADLGAGEGDAVAALLELWPAARVVALEANPESRERLAELACAPVAASLEEWIAGPDPACFDLLLLFDLLEHLRDPRGLLGALVARRLAPGGRLLATFPNVASASRRLLGPLWPQYKVEHLFYFSRAGVAELGRRAGLETLLLQPLAKRLPLDYLLAVGSHFGPAPLRPPARWLRRVLPAALARARLALRLGEWLWVARRPTATGYDREAS